MANLAKENVEKLIFPFMAECKRDGDWWHGTEEGYDNCPHGYDVNVFDKEFDDKLQDNELRCSVYPLYVGEDGNKVADVSKDILSFSFSCNECLL